MVKILHINTGCIQEHMPEENADNVAAGSSPSTDCIWTIDVEAFREAAKVMKYVFIVYSHAR